MQISQSALLQLYLLSFLAGCGLSVLYDLFYMLRLWLLPPKARYTVPTIAYIYAKQVPTKSKKRKGRTFRIALFLGDVLFCIISAIVLILLLYGLNDGVFRISAPLCMAVGFASVRVSLARPCRILFQCVAFGIEMLCRTLLAPFKALYRLIKGACKKRIAHRRIKKYAKQRKQYTRWQHLNIDKTVVTLLPMSSVSTKEIKKGAGRAKQGKKAV